MNIMASIIYSHICIFPTSYTKYQISIPKLVIISKLLFILHRYSKYDIIPTYIDLLAEKVLKSRIRICSIHKVSLLL